MPCPTIELAQFGLHRNTQKLIKIQRPACYVTDPDVYEVQMLHTPGPCVESVFPEGSTYPLYLCVI